MLGRFNYQGQAVKVCLAAGILIGMVSSVARAQDSYRGRVLEQAGQFEPAFQAYRSEIELNPGDHQALAGFIRMCRQLGRYDSLITVLRRLESKSGESDELSLGVILGLLKTKCRQEALVRAEALMQRSPERVLELVAVLREVGEVAAATGYLERALNSDFRVDYALRLAEIYKEMGRGAKAAGIIADIVNKDGGRLAHLVDRLAELGQHSDVKRVVAVLGKIRDGKLRARAQAAVYLGAGEELAAVRVLLGVYSEQELYLFARECERNGALKAALTIYNEQGAWADGARVLRALGRVDEALRMLSRDSTIAGRLEFAEIARLDQRDFKKAVASYLEVLRTRPNDRVALYGLARGLVGLKLLDSAQKFLKRIAKPDDQVLLLVAQVFFYQGEFDSVKRWVGELCHRFPKSPLVNDGLELEALTFSGERAKVLAEAILDYEVDNDEEGMSRTRGLIEGKDLVAQEAFLLLARFYYRQGRYKEALAVLDTFLIRFPRGELGAKARLQQAEIYREGLKDEVRSRLMLERLIGEFPGSAYVPIARNRLRKSAGEIKPSEVR
ncbi:MAG: tetratricopeptide repeat protein [bacterium]